MDRTFRPFHALLLGVFASAFYRLFLTLPDLVQHAKEYGAFAVPAIGLGLGLLFSRAEWVTTTLLRMRWLRRLLALSADIEGDWPLIVVDGKTGQMRYYGFMTIGYKDGYLDVHGDDWHPNDVHAVDFQSQQSQYKDGLLHYWYVQGEDGHQRGYTYIHFFPKKAVATRHTGVFIDKFHPDVRFYARKQAYGWFERRPQTQEEKRQVARAFADLLRPITPALVQTSVSADWSLPAAKPAAAAPTPV